MYIQVLSIMTFLQVIAISLHYFIDRNNNYSFIIPSKDDGVPMQNVYRESRLECTNRMRWPYIYVNSEHCTLFRAKWEDTLHLSQSHQFVLSLINTKSQRKQYIFYSICFYTPINRIIL